MNEQTNTELIAAHQFDSGNCSCGLPWHECPYAPYAERLEATDQRAELAEANLSVEESKNAGYRAKNNQLAAVVEKVRGILPHQNRLDEYGVMPLRWAVRKANGILATIPADALCEHDAALIEKLATEAGYSLVHHEEAVAFLRREAHQRREERA